MLSFAQTYAWGFIFLVFTVAFAAASLRQLDFRDGRGQHGTAEKSFQALGDRAAGFDLFIDQIQKSIISIICLRTGGEGGFPQLYWTVLFQQTGSKILANELNTQTHIKLKFADMDLQTHIKPKFADMDLPCILTLILTLIQGVDTAPFLSIPKIEKKIWS